MWGSLGTNITPHSQIGHVAFQLCEHELGIRLVAEAILQTGDLDIASFERLSLAIGDTVTEDVGDVLKKLEFDPVPSMEHQHFWKWRQTRRDTFVEFRTPALGSVEIQRELMSAAQA